MHLMLNVVKQAKVKSKDELGRFLAQPRLSAFRSWVSHPRESSGGRKDHPASCKLRSSLICTSIGGGVDADVEMR